MEGRRNVLYLVPRTLYFVLFLLLLACGKDHDASNDTYTCPMHPTVIADKPGTCPVCGMNLIKKARPGETKVTEDLTGLVSSPNEVVVSSIKTIKGEFSNRALSVKASGVVTYDTRYLYTIASRMDGRLEKVDLKYNLQPVRKGQKVAEIYSPELATAQRELLFLLEHDAENQNLIADAKSKLSLLGATKQQVEEITKGREIAGTFSIYSPYDGYVIQNDQQRETAPATSSASQGMNDSGMRSAKTTAVNAGETPVEFVREGNYVSAGQTLFRIVNTSALRVELDLPASTEASVKVGSEIMLEWNGGMREKVAVDFVQPFFTEGQEFIKVRVVVRGEKLRIGELMDATIQLGTLEALWLPRESVLDLGLDKIVFVKERGVFKPRKIITGIQTDGWISIERGLSSSEEVSSNAQYLVDSESFIKSK